MPKKRSSEDKAAIKVATALTNQRAVAREVGISQPAISKLIEDDSPEVEAIVQEIAEPLRVKLEKYANMAVDILAADLVKEKREVPLTVVFDKLLVLIDKIQLLSGQPTQITKQLTPDEARAKAAEVLRLVMPQKTG